MEELRDELNLTGRLGLDFVNTVVPLRTGPVDLLRHPDDFVWWARHAMPSPLPDLLPPDAAGLRRLVGEAARLREALVSTFQAVAESPDAPPPAPAAAVLDHALAAAASIHRRRDLAVEVRFIRGRPLAVLTPITLSALHVARTTRPGRLRACAADRCQRWFVDTSKGGRRRWCSMERCGNRAKAERYRRRHSE